MHPLRRFVLIALALLLLVGGVRALEEIAVQRVLAAGDQGAMQAAENAVERVADRLTLLQTDLHQRARRLVDAPEVREALMQGDASRAIVLFDRLDLPDGYAAELYTPLPELIAWRGPGLPLDPAARRLAFLDTTQSAIVEDGVFRTGMAVWMPVRDEGRVIGAVRTVRVLRMQVPVRNEYLRDFDLLEEWTRGLAAPVSVVYADRSSPEADLPEVVERVRSLDGFLLARVSAEPPTEASIVFSLRSRYRQALSFAVALLFGWGLFGLILVTRRSFGHALETERPGPRLRAGVSFLAVLGAIWGFRYALLSLGMPARLVAGSPTPAAFDPAFLGSGFGGGIAGSAVELVITAVFALFTGGVMAAAGVQVARYRRQRVRAGDDERPGAGTLLRLAVAAVISVAVLIAGMLLVHRATADATLGYFDRAGPFPEGLVMLAFGSFLLVMLSVVLVAMALALFAGVGDRRRAVAGLLTGGAAILGAAAILPWPGFQPVIGVAVLATGGFAAFLIERDPGRWVLPFSMRGVLAATLVLAFITYPIVSQSLAIKEEARLRDALQDFVDGEDPRVAFALESVLVDARNAPLVRQTLARAAQTQVVRPGLADSLAADLVTGSLLAGLGDYQVGLTLHDPDGRVLGRHVEEVLPRGFADAGQAPPRPPDPFAFNRLRRLYDVEADFAGFVVERRPAGQRGSKFRYAGIGPVRMDVNGERTVGWITARAEPRPARYVAETPFPRVLVPAGLHRFADDEWVFADFEDGVLHRSRGADFGRFRLPDPAAALPVGESMWRTEQLEGQRVRIFYQRLSPERVVAARLPDTTLFDHLFFLLRILTPGLLIAGLVYLLGWWIRRASDMRPHRPRLRDRVLNRFLLVGVLAILATGLIGRSVIVTQNREAVEERLKRQLARVEAMLYEDVAGDEETLVPPERILDRARLEVVTPRLGLDVNLYRGAELVASSRSQLVRQRLIEPRLPVEVVRKLFVDGERYAFATEQIGRFQYTVGYEALPGPDGRPAVVLAVPTLPEQLAIEADQARMIAYLFGVLLLLLLVIFVIATVLANRLTQPFRRLREGLRAVGAGEAPSEPIPVESRDEVGEVIETFNAVWDQLEDSRRRLAAQERELAWREMARQVAHEIKNPLTPMRLSVQHLRRAYERAEKLDGGPDGQFGELLDSISATLIEQIDALNRIAGEFSRLGKMPERDLEVFDVNEVMRQAAALVSEEARAEIVLDLSRESLPVRADREELRRVYINLLKNAQQAIPENERGIITLTTRARKGEGGPGGASAWAETMVRDTGTGIPEEVQPRVFQPNFSTKTSGMGLGLAIARKTIEDLHGHIDFETRPGVGTTFVISLPLIGV